MNIKVAAIVVCYEPNIKLLDDVLIALNNQVSHIYMFDNSEGESILLPYACNKVSVFSLNKNVGIAYAQNYLVKKARSSGYKYALFSDQDTIYPALYVKNMLDIYYEFKDTNLGITPSFIIKTAEGREFLSGVISVNSKNEPYSYRGNDIVEVLHAISSGMIVSLEIYTKVGGVDEELFIDWVDNDLSWRAYINGTPFLGTANIHIRHQLGDEQVKVLGRNYTKRSNLRDYYIVRNGIYLSLFKFRSFSIGRNYLIKKVFHHVFFSFLSSKNKFMTIKYLYTAIKHGFNKRLGKF